MALLSLCIGAVLACGASGQQDPSGPEVVIGSKKFTESVILGEMARALVQHAGAEATHRKELGGTRILFEAVARGDIDIYPEYTGTLQQEIFAGRDLQTFEDISAALAERGLAMTGPLGFDNTYAIAMRKDRAAQLEIESISDLRDHPDLRFGFGNEFMDRGDGWGALRQRYRLAQQDVRGLDHDLAYRGIAAGDIDVMDAYATDAEIDYYDLRVLEDDLGHFPEYEAVFVYRIELRSRAPRAVAELRRLEGAIDAGAMSGLNKAVKLDGRADGAVAAGFLQESLGLRTTVARQSRWASLWQRTVEHTRLVGISMLFATLMAVPLGVLAAKARLLEQPTLAVVGVAQTIPSLAFLALLVPLQGIGERSAIIALTVYSLLPIVRNTHAGIVSMTPQLRDAAASLGLSASDRLLWVDLPLAAPSIFAGLKTAAVLNVGTATLGALIGAGGYGQPILTGIRLDDPILILEGAAPAALMAIAAQRGLDLLERLIVPRGLRTPSRRRNRGKPAS
ncbi:MAG: glycine betaine ABC transporter substrate-binding protein [Phycisphaerales bacterium JB039]